MRSQSPTPRAYRIGVLVLSQYAEPEYVLALLEGGATGIDYLLKDRIVAAGGMALNRTRGSTRRSRGSRPTGRPRPDRVYSGSRAQCAGARQSDDRISSRRRMNSFGSLS